MSKSLSLREWIEKEGVDTIAKLLRVTRGAVGHWKRGYVLPDSKQLARIRELTKGAVSIDKSLEEHFSAKNKNRWRRLVK